MDEKKERPKKKRIVFPELFEDLRDLVTNKDITMTGGDIRHLVDWYYNFQDGRKRACQQVFASDNDPIRCIQGLANTFESLEKQTEEIITIWVKRDPLCQWPMQVKGLGPVLCAGLAAHIDMNKAKHRSSVFALCGLAPGIEWIGRKKANDIAEALRDEFDKPGDCIEVAAKRVGFKPETVEKFSLLYGKGRHTWESLSKAISRKPWNDRLKVIAWKIADSFVKHHNTGLSYYGERYNEFKALYVARNENGEYKGLTQELLGMKKKRWSANQRAAYKQGRLTDGHIELRARRRTVKLFLSHWWEESYKQFFGKPSDDKPYPNDRGGHVHFIPSSVVLEYERSKANEERQDSDDEGCTVAV